MDETITNIVIVVFIILIVLAILVWLIRVGAVLAAAFTVFMLDLPLIIMLLAFILFPPTLIVFLIGWFMLSVANKDDYLDDLENEIDSDFFDEEGKVTKPDDRKIEE